MATRIFIDEEDMLDYYDQVMDEVYLKYHTHPTNLPHHNPTEAELAEIACNNGYGRAPGGQARDKRVHYHRDEAHSNGLPRKR